jgi:hypothetical protein
MRIRNDDRMAYREGRFDELEPQVLEYLKSVEPKLVITENSAGKLVVKIKKEEEPAIEG